MTTSSTASTASTAPSSAPLTASTPSPTKRNKRIGIVGAGTGGLGALLALLDLPQEYREGWTVEVLEKRQDVGGIWLPENTGELGEATPETGLYPALTTNTAVPTMTFSGYPFPPATALFPSHTHIRSYLSSVVERAQLQPYLHFGVSVEHAAYEDRRWVVKVARSAVSGKEEATGGTRGELEVREYDHLIVATGRYHHPNLVHYAGEEDWLATTSSSSSAGEDLSRPGREIVHSLWYRGPEKYEGRTVVVVGFGASGWDIASQIQPVADEVYHSYTPHPEAPVQLPPVVGTVYKPRISHFTPDAVVFADGSALPAPADSPVSIILATGYSLSIPFLSPHLLQHAPLSPSSPPPGTLTTNGEYIRPLYRDLIALDPRLPPNALGIIGLPWHVAASQASYIQGLVLAHAFASEDEAALLPEKCQEGALKALVEEEEERKKVDKVEPFEVGHNYNFRPSQPEDYQDSLLALLRTRSSIPLPPHLSSPSTPYVPAWRRWGRSETIKLRTAFAAAVAEGVEEQFRAEEGTEEEWVEVLERLRAYMQTSEKKEQAAKEAEAEKSAVSAVEAENEKENKPLAVPTAATEANKVTVEA
ncbi:hypothetical protein JCM8097_000263 [Rhodosporidiobolus ruineniae]